jgi:hypothetical protein
LAAWVAQKGQAITAKARDWILTSRAYWTEDALEAQRSLKWPFSETIKMPSRQNAEPDGIPQRPSLFLSLEPDFGLRWAAQAATNSLSAIVWSEQRSVFQDFIGPTGLLRVDTGPISARAGGKEMAENRRIWPLLVYGGLAAIAAARRAQTERTPAIGSREIGREPRQITYPAPDESGESLGESRPAAQVDPDKRPKEQIENDQPISAQLRRAKQQGRGRRAMAPWEIPWAGWKDIFWRVYASVNDNRLLAVAAGVVFYSLLAIFPAIAAFVSLYGLIADASTIDSHLSLAAGIFPAGAVDILHEQIARLTAKGDAKLSLGLSFRRRPLVPLESRHRCSPVAVAAGPGGDGLGRDLSQWTKPRRSALAMAFGRERGCSHRMADHLGSLLLVHRPFRRIQCNLWVAWSRRRHDDVDVDLSHRHLAWRRA